MFKCTVFEDNNGALELESAPKIRPRTKHIAIKHHHFRAHVANGSINIETIDTTQQKAYILIKTLVALIFKYLRKISMGW